MENEVKRKPIKVWLERRKNPKKKDGSQTISYTLEWIVEGKRHFKSLGSKISFEDAERLRAEKEEGLRDEKKETDEPPTKNLTAAKIKRRGDEIRKQL